MDPQRAERIALQRAQMEQVLKAFAEACDALGKSLLRYVESYGNTMQSALAEQRRKASSRK